VSFKGFEAARWCSTRTGTRCCWPRPAITAADLATSSPTLSALRRAVAETVQRIVDGLGAAESPLTLVTGAYGAPRVVRRRCDLLEHLRGVAEPGERLFPFAPQPQ
jgi:hypothetical protein